MDQFVPASEVRLHRLEVASSELAGTQQLGRLDDGLGIEGRLGQPLSEHQVSRGLRSTSALNEGLRVDLADAVERPGRQSKPIPLAPCAKAL